MKNIHYIHAMLVTLIACMALALFLNRVAFGRRATFSIEDFRASRNALD